MLKCVCPSGKLSQALIAHDHEVQAGEVWANSFGMYSACELCLV